MKAGDIIKARTHAELLNEVFGTNYKQWYKSVWEYDSNYIVWMVRFDGKNRSGWVNEFISPDEIREENLYNATKWNGKTVLYNTGQKRLTFEIDESGLTRKYIFKGVFAPDEEKSNPYRVRYYYKVSDTFSV